MNLRTPAGPPAVRRAARCAALSWVALASLSSTSAAGAATVKTVPIKSWVNNVAVEADGTARLSVSLGSYSGEQGQLEVGPDALIGGPLLLQPLRRPGDQKGYAEMTSDGAIVVYRTLRQPHPRVRVLQWRAGKQVGSGQTISDPRHAARGYAGVVTSPSGAATVSFIQHLGGGRWIDRVAYRPAGAQRFQPAVDIDPGRSYRNSNASYNVVLGPQGDGAIAIRDKGGPWVRRIGKDGALGPKIAIPVDEHAGQDGMDLAVSSAGDIGFAWSTRDIPAGDPRTADDRQIATREAWIAELPAGADAVSEPRKVASVTNGADASYEPTAAFGPGDAFLAAFNGNGRIQLWEGADAATATNTASFASTQAPYFIDGLFLFATSDGGAAALWTNQMMLRSPEGVWSAPEPVLVGADPNSNVENAVPSPDGGVVAVVSEWPPEDDVRHFFVARIHR